MFSRELYSKQAACQMCRPGLKNEKHGHWTWTCLDRPSKRGEQWIFPHQQLNYFDILTSWRSTTKMHIHIHRYRVHRTNISVCFSDVLVSCDTIMNNTRGTWGLRVARGAHTQGPGPELDRGNFVVGRSGEFRLATTRPRVSVVWIHP